MRERMRERPSNTEPYEALSLNSVDHSAEGSMSLDDQDGKININYPYPCVSNFCK